MRKWYLATVVTVSNKKYEYIISWFSDNNKSKENIVRRIHLKNGYALADIREIILEELFGDEFPLPLMGDVEENFSILKQLYHVTCYKKAPYKKIVLAITEFQAVAAVKKYSKIKDIERFEVKRVFSKNHFVPKMIIPFPENFKI